jgi:hypothetical protein
VKSFIGLKIIDFKIGEYNLITIRLNDSSVYSADLSSFNKVDCYPSESEWEKAFLGEFKTDIEWPSGFGIHLDQIAGLSLGEDWSA